MGYQDLRHRILGIAVLVVVSTHFPSSVIAQEMLPSAEQCRLNPPTDSRGHGWCVVIQKHKGNCLACHQIDIDPWPHELAPGGTLGPVLTSIKQRFPDRAKLRAQIWDATRAKPRSAMPPFGKHRLLSEQEIDLVVDFLLTI